MKQLALALAVSAAGLALSGCDNLTDKISEQLDTLSTAQSEAGNQPVTMAVVDAQSGDLIDQPVTVTVQGAENGDIIDDEGAVTMSMAADGGFVHFSLSDTAVATQDQPLKLTVVFQADGYLSTSQTVVLDGSKDVVTSVRMVNKNNPPQGTVSASQQFSDIIDQAGSLTAPVLLQTNPDPETGGNVSINIGTGTVITDDAGTPLSGTLTVDLIYHNNTNEASLAAFPGGFNAQVTRLGGASEQGNFISGGFVSVEVTDASGRQGTQFSSPIQFQADIPAGTINPETGQPVKAGDTIPVWSYNVNTGAWVEESVVVIAAPLPQALSVEATSAFTTSFESSHLSYFNMDWFSSPRCAPRIEIPGAEGWNLQVGAEIIGYYSGYTFTRGDAVVDIANLPKNYPLNFFAKIDGQTVGEVSTSLPEECQSSPLGSYTVELPVNLPAKPEPTQVRITSAECDGFSIQVPSYLALAYRPVNTPAWSFINLRHTDDSSVEIELTLRDGIEYEVNTYYGAYYSIGGKQQYVAGYYAGTHLASGVEGKIIDLDLGVLCSEL